MNSTRFWAVVPAAGTGSRMHAALPKQYLRLAGTTVIELALSPLLRHPALAGVAVVLAPADAHWGTLPVAGNPRVFTVDGARSRARSVLNGLRALRQRAPAGAWVAVHDAARPCLRAQELRMVLAVAAASPGGALLAVPLGDSLKRAASDATVAQSVPRENLWLAQTPQVFRLDELTAALEAALAAGVEPGDEAQAMELAGQRPKLVAGHPGNIKITVPGDLELAEAILRAGAG